MGALVVAPGAPGDWYSKIAFPVMRGLKGYYTFDTDAARFGLNRAPDGLNATLTGLPLAFATHGRFNGRTNFLDTGISETASQTIIVIGKAAAAVADGAATTAQPVYVSNNYGQAVNAPFTGITATGVSLYHPGAARLQISGARDNGSGAGSSASVNLVATAANQWAVRVARINSTGFNESIDLTTGTRAIGTSSTARILNNKTFCIGGNVIGDSALVDISAVAIFAVALTDSEINTVAAVMRKRMERLGIIV